MGAVDEATLPGPHAVRPDEQMRGQRFAVGEGDLDVLRLLPHAADGAAGAQVDAGLGPARVEQGGRYVVAVRDDAYG